jgi:lipopolysaccharide export LptBFGC system permease protein LptF
MVLAIYFFKRFFTYLFSINISLTLLFNFIEFFEKIARVKHATTNTILHFIFLNIVPSFFETLPISCWLATCLLLKEFIQQNEWETLQILNIGTKKLFNLFFIAGTILALTSFIGKEKIVLPLTNKSEKFKLEKLKQGSLQKVLNKWFILTQPNSDNHLFCNFSILDMATNKGKNLLLIYMTPNFEIEKTLNSLAFEFNPEKQNLKISDGIIISSKKKSQLKIENYMLELPSFFSQLQLNLETPSIQLLFHNLIYGKKVLPSDLWDDLLAQLLQRILLHFQIIIYPLLTLCLFLLFPYNPLCKWVLILLPYPIITLLNITTGLSNNVWNVLLPYLTLMLVIFLFKKRLVKTF